MCAMVPEPPIKGVPHVIGRYRILNRKLGSGNYASVVAAEHIDLEIPVAVKIIDTSEVRDPYVLRHLSREARLLRQLAHPNVIAMFESLKVGPLYCLVTELVSGGELCAHVCSQPKGHLDESTARKFTGQLMSALAHMHDHGVVHRDLKMKNILLNEDHDVVKIIDFGLSNEWSPQSMLRTHCGSPGYAAPEVYVLGKPYGPEVDMWSLGVVLYGMAVGSLPFPTCRDKTVPADERRRRLVEQINRGMTQDHVNCMTHFSAPFTDLVIRLLTPEPLDRLGVHHALLHPWLKSYESPPESLYQLNAREQRLIVAKLALLLNTSTTAVQEHCRKNKFGKVAAAYNILAHQHLSKTHMAWESLQFPENSTTSKSIYSCEHRTSTPETKSDPPSELDSCLNKGQESTTHGNLKLQFSLLSLEPEPRTEDLPTISSCVPEFTIMKRSSWQSDCKSVAPDALISTPLVKTATSKLASRESKGPKSVPISHDNSTTAHHLHFQTSGTSTAGTKECECSWVDCLRQTSSQDMTVSHQIINSSQVEDVQQKMVNVTSTSKNVQYFEVEKENELKSYSEKGKGITHDRSQKLTNKVKPLIYNKQKSGVYKRADNRFSPDGDEHTLTRRSVGKQSCKEVTLSKRQSSVELSQKMKLITGSSQLKSSLNSACPSQHTACSREVKEVSKNNYPCRRDEVTKVKPDPNKIGPVRHYMMDVALEEKLGRSKFMTLRPWRIWVRDKNRSASLQKCKSK